MTKVTLTKIYYQEKIISKPKEIMIDEVKYIRADSVKKEVVEFTGDETLASRAIGKNVLIRSRNEGINAGIVVLANETGVEIKSARRLWYHEPKDSSLSWYEGVAVSGINDSSKVSCTVDSKIIIEDYSIIECSKEAFKSIIEKKPHEG